MKKINSYTSRIGRILFSLIFIASGISKIGDWQKTIDYMESHNMLFIPFFLVMAILLQVLGGLSILINYKTKVGVVFLLVFIIPTTFIFHNFWSLPTETEIELVNQHYEMVSFLKNITIIGSLFLIFDNETKKIVTKT